MGRVLGSARHFELRDSDMGAVVSTVGPCVQRNQCRKADQKRTHAISLGRRYTQGTTMVNGMVLFCLPPPPTYFFRRIFCDNIKIERLRTKLETFTFIFILRMTV